MKKERLKELLELTRENLINGDSKIQSGICREFYILIHENKCSLEEKVYLRDYIERNRPTENNQYAQFTIKPFWTNSSFWWHKIKDVYLTKQIRINYLTELIDNLK